MVWEPVEGCKVPIPPPFYFDLMQTTTQSAVLAVLFGYVDIRIGHKEASQANWAVTLGLGFLQIILLLLSVIALNWHFYQESHWRLQCYGCFATESPFIAGALTTALQFRITKRKQILSRQWLEGFEDETAWRNGQGGLTDVKVRFLMVLTYATWFTVMVEYGIFIVVDVAMGMVWFFPVTGALLAGGFLLAKKVGAFSALAKLDEDGVKGKQAEEDVKEAEKLFDLSDVDALAKLIETEDEPAFDREPKAAAAAAEAGKSGQYVLLQFLPLIFAIKFAIKFSFYAMLNFRSGLGWWESAYVVLMERQIKVYISHFEDVATPLFQKLFIFDSYI